MRYLVRSVKYFIQISILMGLVLGALMLTGMVSTDVNVAFRGGWKSIGLIAAMFAAVSAIYPLFGYGKRMISAKGDPAQYRDSIIAAMEDKGYTLEKDDPELGMVFKLRNVFGRITRLWEDRVCIAPELGGFMAEGLIRDVTRIVSTLNYKFRNND